MSKPTVSAAGGAMPAEGHDPDPSRELLSIVDELDEVRYLVDAAWMAADSLTKEARDAMKALISVAFEKLTAARDRLNAARMATPADPIFAAIERHKAVWAAYVEATCKLTLPELDAYQAAHDDDRKALEAFLATPPTTLAGLRAALEHAVEFDSGCVPNTGGQIAETLLRSPVFTGMTEEGSADV